MKKFFTVIILLVIFAMFSYGIAYVVIPVNSMQLDKYTHSISFVSENAFIVRDETVYKSASDGIVYNICSDGDRIAQDLTISTVYDGDVDTQILKKMHTIDSAIDALKSAGQNGSLYETDSDSSENRIAEKMDDVITYAAENNVREIHDIKTDINSIRAREEISDTEKTNRLRDEREKIEKKLSVRKSDIVSDKAGIFSSYVDGLETVLTPDSIEKFTPKKLSELTAENGEYLNGKQINSGTPVCKVMNNHTWYILGIADESRASMLKDNSNVTIRFKNLTESDAKGEVCYISEPDDDGNFVFAVKVNSYLESAFSYRIADAEIIFREYSGYRVPTDAIRTGEGISDYYVYARKGSESYKCDIDVLYSDPEDGYSIITSSADAENNLGAMDRLVIGER